MTRVSKILPPRQKTALTLSNYDYHAINLLLWLFVAACVAILHFTDFHVQCIYKEAGLSCASCGLTTAFRLALRGDFSTIPLAFILLFFLFTLQILLRPTVSFILFYKNYKIVGAIDSVFHIILGVVCAYLLYMHK